MNSYEPPTHRTSQNQVLSVVATPTAPVENLSPVLKHLGWDNTLTVSAGDQPSEGPVLLIHTRPEWAVGHALEDGAEPEQALQAWQGHAKKLLDTFKQRRHDTAMVDAQAAIERPQALVEWLTKHHKAFSHIVPPMSAQVEKASYPSELNLLLATQLVAQAPGIAPLLIQLEACSIPLGEQGYKAPTVNVSSVIQQLTDAQKQTESAVVEPADVEESKTDGNERELEDLKEENDLILKQLFKVQEELEKYYLQSKGQAETLKKRDTELKKLRDSNKSLQKQTAKRQAEISALEKEKRLLTNSVKRLNAQQGFKLTRLAAPIMKLTRTNRALKRSAELVRASELFDAAWYLKQNPDVAALSLDPALHFVRHGGTEGRAASPKFDSASYLSKNPDVAKSGQNPLVHYLLHGKAEDRKL